MKKIKNESNNLLIQENIFDEQMKSNTCMNSQEKKLKTLIETSLPIKRKKIFQKKKFKNPGITHFNIDSNFIYDLSKSKIFIRQIEDKNNIKLNKKEIKILSDEIFKIETLFQNDEKNIFLDISLNEIQNINDYFTIKEIENEEVKWIKNKINNDSLNEKISCIKLSKIYNQETGKVLCKTKINNILKNKLKLSYLKTNVKTSRIITPNSTFMCICFIKIITRAIALGFNILFMDESSILSKNNSFRTWRTKNQNIYFNLGPNKRSNVSLIISKNEIIYYKINKTNTNENKFLEFMNEALKEIKLKKIEKYIIVLDNLSSHKTSKVINFFKDNNINIVYNCPYCSYFNCIELIFRYIKRNLYLKVYESLETAENDVKNLLDSNNIKNTLIKNYKEVLNTYLAYSLNNKYNNLNNLEYII